MQRFWVKVSLAARAARGLAPPGAKRLWSADIVQPRQPVAPCLAFALVTGLSLPALAEPRSGGQPAASALIPPADSAAADALVFDILRIVSSEENGGWLIDEVAYERIHHDVMESVCRATPAARAGALARLERESADLGDPQQLFAEDGELSGRVAAALTAQRRLTALRRATASADAQCPFWLRPDPEFRGLQSARDRVIINFDTGGTVQLRRSSDTWTVGAGGFGRLLAGYGFSSFSLLAGLEFGGGALLEPDTDPTQFVINYIPALPLIVRLHHGAWHLDLESAPVALFQAVNADLSYGVRAGATLGVSSLRLRGILPWVGLGVAAEYHFGNEARPAAQYLRGGFRVGGVWDP